MVFDIQRNSLHDGPGIRTCVFLKGCPLRCKWCSNPESFQSGHSLAYMEDLCISCMACTQVCPSGALQEGPDGLIVNHASCTACGLCLEECPQDALKIYGYETTTEEILNEVLKDQPYYERSGGGLTLSGGEVMMQAGFAREILLHAKQAGIHTCVETSGYGRKEDFEALLPWVDLFLFDYKATGKALHRELCGVDPDRIAENLEFLDSRGASIHLRCPIIPGLNDSEDHFRAIRELKDKYPCIKRVEILPYHNYGEHKYAQLGQAGHRKEYLMPTEDDVQQWMQGI